MKKGNCLFYEPLKWHSKKLFLFIALLACKLTCLAQTSCLQKWIGFGLVLHAVLLRFVNIKVLFYRLSEFKCAKSSLNGLLNGLILLCSSVALKIRVKSVSLLLVCLKKVPNLHGVCVCVRVCVCVIHCVCVFVCHCFQKSEKSFQVGGENVILQGEESELPASFTYILVLPREKDRGEDCCRESGLKLSCFLKHLHTKCARAISCFLLRSGVSAAACSPQQLWRLLCCGQSTSESRKGQRDGPAPERDSFTKDLQSSAETKTKECSLHLLPLFSLWLARIETLRVLPRRPAVHSGLQPSPGAPGSCEMSMAGGVGDGGRVLYEYLECLLGILGKRCGTFERNVENDCKCRNSTPVRLCGADSCLRRLDDICAAARAIVWGPLHQRSLAPLRGKQTVTHDSHDEETWFHHRLGRSLCCVGWNVPSSHQKHRNPPKQGYTSAVSHGRCDTLMHLLNWTWRANI